MIATKPYNLTQKVYTELVIKKRFKKSWWLFALMLVLSFFNLNKFGEDRFATFTVIFGFAYPVIVFVYLYFWSSSKSQKLLFSSMNMSFDNSDLYFKRDGNESKIPSTNIIKIDTKKDFWMLYVFKGNFIYVPKDIFYSESDKNSFLKLLNINE